MTISWDFPYPSQRMPVLANNVVAASQPLAAQAGIDMLQNGGNAVDAALACAITLTVVEPTGTGVGSDAFALVWDGEKLHALNGSGRSPAAWTTEHFARYTEFPTLGWDTVTIPGAVSAWERLSDRFGVLPFEALFEPAIRYARHGFHVSPIIARNWARAAALYWDFPEWGRVFLPDGKAPRAGERFRCEDLAETLLEIAETRGASFYTGSLADRITAHAAATGGLMRRDDLAGHRPMWVQPLATDVYDCAIHELPPNTQGIAALMMLGMVRHTPAQEYAVDSAESLHLHIEAMKLAFADVFCHVADPGWMPCEPHDLLDPEYLRQRARTIDMHQARMPANGLLRQGQDTVYLSAADASGMMVSFIQSNYLGFGSGIVIPGTGIAMQNRGCGFTLEPHHPNQVHGKKRPFHTLMPGFVTRNGRPVMSFGCMGGHMQPQGHAQLAARICGYGQNPQAACDAPRWHLFADFRVGVEAGFPPDVLEALHAKGHAIVTDCPPDLFGGAQIIYRLDDGAYLAASDPRKDGLALGY
jgi:gamma-glutamyltranspeptidase / glutathione hydrolase